MAITLPIGIRIAAGLLGTTIDRLVKLPQELPTLGISLAGQAVRTSLRIQQEIAELATRGDELLAGITGRPEENPPWATFDEDEDEDPKQEGDREPAEPSPTPGTPPTITPPTMQGDQRLSVAELKEALQDMEIEQVRELLSQEEAGPARAPYLTLFENRLVTMEHETGQSQSR